MNQLLARAGHFWQREYFDHLVRHEASLGKIVKYVMDNPSRAGLRNWPWIYCTADLQDALSGEERRQDGGGTK